MRKILLIFLLMLSTFKTDAQSSVLDVAEASLEQGNYQSALKTLLNEEKKTVEVLLKIAEIYKKTGNYTNAIKFYNIVYALKPSDKVKEQLGKCYQYAGNSKKAIALQSEVLKANPDNLLLQYNLAKLYAATRNSNKAIDLFNDLVKKDSLNPNYFYELGRISEKRKNDPTKFYLKVYQLDSIHVKSIYQLAKFFNKIKVRDSAGLFIDKGLTIDAKNINFLQLKAQHEFLNKEYDTTLVYLKKLEEQDFKTPFVHKLFGLSYFKLKDYENALLNFNKVRKADYKDADNLFNIGLVHVARKEFKNAEMILYLSIAFQKPDIDKNYFELGKAQLEQEEVKKALESFQQGYKNNPRNYQLLFQLAMLTDDYYKDKNVALKHYEKYVEKFSSKDQKSTLYAKSRIKDIKKELFMKAESEK